MAIDLDKNKWIHWPLSKEGFLRYQNTKNMRRRLEILSPIFLIISGILIYYSMAYYGVLLVIGTIIAWIYYYLILTGKIQYKK